MRARVFVCTSKCRKPYKQMLTYIFTGSDMTDTKLIIPIAVRATSVADPNTFRLFPSLYAAKNVLAKEFGIKVHHERIRKDALAGKEAHGFRWELVNPPETEQAAEADGSADDRYVFTFRENVEALFAGGKVRVTDENPRRASVFDIIRVVTQTTNPRVAYEALRAEDVSQIYDLFTFPGIGQRPTPVTDAAGLIELVTLLPGKRARQFRRAACDVLVRYLAGDQTLHAEVDENADRQDAQPDEHPMRMMSQHVHSALGKASTFLSPNMQGQRIGQFNKTPVVYLLRFEYNGVVYAKVGFSRDILERMKKHVKELPGCQIYAMIASSDAEAIEQEFKEQFCMHRVHLKVEGSVKTELFVDLCLSEFEQGMHEISATLQARTQVSPMQAIQQMFNRAMDLLEAGKLQADSKCIDALADLMKQKVHN